MVGTTTSVNSQNVFPLYPRSRVITEHIGFIHLKGLTLRIERGQAGELSISAVNRYTGRDVGYKLIGPGKLGPWFKPLVLHWQGLALR